MKMVILNLSPTPEIEVYYMSYNYSVRALEPIVVYNAHFNSTGHTLGEYV